MPFIIHGAERFLGDITIMRVGDPNNSYYSFKTAGVFLAYQEIDVSTQLNALSGSN